MNPHRRERSVYGHGIVVAVLVCWKIVFNSKGKKVKAQRTSTQPSQYVGCARYQGYTIECQGLVSGSQRRALLL